MTDCRHDNGTRTVRVEYEKYVLVEVYCKVCGKMIDSYREYK